MADVIVTEEIVRNLSTVLSNTDTTKLADMDRLRLVAHAFGWETDAFMQAIKQSETEVSPFALPPHFTSSWGPPRAPTLEALGVFDVDTWKSAAQSASGVMVTVGPAASGKTSILAATANYLHQQGRQVFNLQDVGPSVEPTGQSVLFVGAVGSTWEAEEAFYYAEKGFLVLVSVHATTLLEGLRYLRDHLGLGDRIAWVKGAMAQRVVRRSGRDDTLVTEVKSFLQESAGDFFDRERPFRVREAATIGFAPAVLSLVRDRRLDLDDIEKYFGNVVRESVEHARG
jgi:hypothetical protein